MKNKKDIRSGNMIHKAVIELLSWGVPADVLLDIAKLVISMEGSGWGLDKRAAFAARKAGIEVGDIGPRWARDEPVNTRVLNSSSALVIENMRMKGILTREDILQFSAQFPEYQFVLKSLI
jgi:hypothetical protein